MSADHQPAAERALATLSGEQRNLWRLILLLDRLRHETDTRDACPDEVLLSALLDYFEQYSERVQSRPREILLFQCLRRRAEEALPEVDELEADYLSAHEDLQHLRALLHRCVMHWPEGREALAQALERFSQTLRRHVRLEEEVVLPRARALLTPEDWTAITEARDQYDDPLFGARVREEFKALRHQIIHLAPEHVGGLGIDHPTRLEPMAPGCVLRVRGLVSSYGRICALHQVDLDIHRGEIVSLVGANGAGKSTLLMTLSGLQPMDAGEVLYEGEDLKRYPPDRRVSAGIVQVPEGRQVFRDMTVDDNLRLGAYVRGRGRAVNEDLDRIYGRFPILRQKRRQPAGTLSGGQQQMLALGRALMAAPRLLLLDEPSMGLAPLVVEEIFDILQELNREGITMFLVEQNAAQALSISHRGYVLEAGRVVLSGSGQDLLQDEQVRSAYLGI